MRDDSYFANNLEKSWHTIKNAGQTNHSYKSFHVMPFYKMYYLSLPSGSLIYVQCLETKQQIRISRSIRHLRQVFLRKNTFNYSIIHLSCTNFVRPEYSGICFNVWKSTTALTFNHLKCLGNFVGHMT